jgi:sulfite reductase (NADPH) flavoprotein alpha-component
MEPLQLSTARIKLLEELAAAASRDELLWMSGYLAGRSAIASSAPQPTLEKPAGIKRFTVLYGTETGNSRSLAQQLGARAKAHGLTAKIAGLDQFRVKDLAKEQVVFAIVSTQGDGEPPVAAKPFFSALTAEKPDLKHLLFSVLALGDSAYPKFCAAGKTLDQLFEKCGAQRCAPLQLADTEFEPAAEAWFASLFSALNHQPSTPANATATVKPAGKVRQLARVKKNILLNDTGSFKKTFHLELAVDESCAYEPGDAVGIYPENDDALITAILAKTGLSATDSISHAKETAKVHVLLKRVLNLTDMSPAVLIAYGKLAGGSIPEGRYTFLELIQAFPLSNAAAYAEAIIALEPLAPRLYSIASSPEAHPGEIHLTVAQNTFISNRQKRLGVGSCYLCGLQEGAELPFFIHKNRNFRLPAPEADLIMVGPGTGIAPFRSFLWQRDATGAPGRNWLFFGEQQFVTDFYYQTELQQLLQTGTLTKLSVAFSRDQEQKIYVQHRMQAQGAELVRWLDNGAFFYICGAKEPMSRDVETTLIAILKEQKNWDSEQAEAFLQDLKQQGRYRLDVY